jgi:integrase/recombinase XerD
MTMKTEVFISIYLDTRRKKSNGKYPVKLRVFSSYPRKQKFYPTTFEFTEKEFESIWLTARPRNEYKDIRNDIISIEKKSHFNL